MQSKRTSRNLKAGIQLLVSIVCFSFAVSDVFAATKGLVVFGNRYTVKASSELRSTNHRYSASNVLPPSIHTAWCEGVSGLGIGQTLHLKLSKSLVAPVVVLGILPGYAKSESLYRENARPEMVAVRFNGVLIKRIAIDDALHEQSFLLNTNKVHGKVEEVTLEIEKVYPGSKYQDMCISEISLQPRDWREHAGSVESEEEGKVIIKELKGAHSGDIDAIESMVKLAGGTYYQGAEGSEWLGEMYVDLFIEHPGKLLYVTEKQPKAIREVVYDALTHPVTDKYSRKELMGALARATHEGISKQTVNFIRENAAWPQ